MSRDRTRTKTPPADRRDQPQVPAETPQRLADSSRRKEEQKAYQRLVKAKAPQKPVLRHLLGAFLIGGTISTIGQLVLNGFVVLGMTPDEAVNPTAGTMIFLGALFTGLGVYDRIAKIGGMGAALPITGFANAIVAPALEAKREGYVLGVGAHMFQIAGPVLVYGTVVAWFVALIRVMVVGLV